MFKKGKIDCEIVVQTVTCETSEAFKNEDGESVTQAGFHPYDFTTTFDVNTKEESGEEIPERGYL